MKEVQEKEIFVVYEAGLIFKGIQAFLEIVIGLLFYAVSTNTITTFLLYIAHGEFLEIPNDYLSDFLVKSAYQYTSSGKLFIVFYLLTHGIIKLVIIGGLFLKKKWAYPASLIGLGGLIIYQIYRLFVGYSIFLLVLSIMDIIILWLIWHEHRIKTVVLP